MDGNKKSKRKSKDPICEKCYNKGHTIEYCILNDTVVKDYSQTTCLSCRKKGHANCNKN